MHSFAISLLTACTEKCHWIHLSLSLSLFVALILSLCLSLGHLVFPSIFPSLYLPLLSALLSVCLVCRCLIPFFLTFLSVYFDHSPCLSCTVIQRERDWQQDKNRETECVLERLKGIVRVFEVGLYEVLVYIQCITCSRRSVANPQFGETEIVLHGS